jgi:hypothetical protein
MKPKLAVLLFVVGVFVVAPGKLGASTDYYGSLAFHPFTLENCTPPTPDSHGRGNCDPVNLIFPGKTVTQVRYALQARGWTTWGFGSTQYMHFNTDSLTPQNIQMYRYEGFTTRYHIRLWQGPGPVTIASVHHEQGFFTHTLDRDWEHSEAFIASQLCATARSCGLASLPEQDATQGADGEWRGLANDARARVITLR